VVDIWQLLNESDSHSRWGLNTETCFWRMEGGTAATCLQKLEGSLQLLAGVDILGKIFE